MSTRPPDSKPSAPALLVEHDALPAGTRFGELELLSVLGVGGFGIVYLARDHALERDVALKEYMPASLATRGQGTQITIRSRAYAETYAAGLRSFVNEARLLARFDHPSLLKVYRFWEDNATAYMVMPYLRGRTLRDARRAMVMPPDEAWIRSVLDPVTNALELLHREGVYHRDIAPDNILLSEDGPPVLLDFGAARRVISDRTQSLTAILKPSYAPIEQYAEMAAMRQGPWTDVYALGAVVHFLLLGAPPAPATARALHDAAHPLARCGLSGVSPGFLAAIDWALAVRPQDRPRSVGELRLALDGRLAPTADAAAPAPARGVETPKAAPAAMPKVSPVSTFEPTLRVESPGSRSDGDLDPDATVVIRAGATAAPTRTADAPSAGANPGSSPGPSGVWAFAEPAAAMAAPRTVQRGWLVALGAALLGTAGLAYWWAAAPVEVAPPRAAASATAESVVEPAAAAPRADNSPSAEPAVPTAAPVAVAAPAPSLAAVSNALSVPPPVAASRALVVPERRPEGMTRVVLPEARGQRMPVRDDSAAALPALAPAAAPEDPATAREACGSRVLFALWSCLERECRKPRFSQHPECVRLLENRSSENTR